MEIYNHIDRGEQIKLNFGFNKKSLILNSLVANLIYIIMWIAFDVFFIYIMTLESVNTQFWFICVPTCGFNLLIIWTFILKVLKNINEKLKSGYITTDKAIYFYNNGKYKQLVRIEFSEIIAVEKSEYYGDGFFVASINKTIHVKDIKQEKEFFDHMVEKIKKY